MSLEKYMETILHFASTGPYREDLLSAREDFFARLGHVSEEEEKYEERLRSFLDWYVFDRPLQDTGRPPVDTFYDKFQRTFSDEDKIVYDGFCKSFQSLFIVRKNDDQGVWVKDLITARKYFVEDDMPKGFFRDEMFQVRLIPFKGGIRFGDAFTFHPLAANKTVLKRLKRLDRTDAAQVRAFLDDLVRRRHNADRYRHVDAVQFYEKDL